MSYEDEMEEYRQEEDGRVDWLFKQVHDQRTLDLDLLEWVDVGLLCNYLAHSWVNGDGIGIPIKIRSHGRYIGYLISAGGLSNASSHKEAL